MSLELLIRALLAVGASRREVANALARRVAWVPLNAESVNLCSKILYGSGSALIRRASCTAR